MPHSFLRDHPRVCGEKDGAEYKSGWHEGSPPRVRGKALHLAVHGLRVWITPACAGKSYTDTLNNIAAQDHPRVCGEKSDIEAYRKAVQGSPPRVRGKVVRHGLQDAQHGITPACAGKSFPFDGLSIAKRDHPRVCGEKSFASSIGCFCLGSPPRVRGKVARLLAVSAADRITPACAGKSLGAAAVLRVSWDHPRVCGEKCQLVSMKLITVGSPPRVRGKALSPEQSMETDGITPACAGKRPP